MAYVHAEFMSYCLKRTVPITAVLPCDAANFLNTGPQPAQVPYKTLYLLHGIYGSDMDWIANTNIQRLAREHQIAVIMPAGENHFYTDGQGSAAKYGEFIGRELVEVTRRMFQLSDRREDTWIGGFSMGGYGAFMNGMIYHETFSHIACMSMVVMSQAYLDNTKMLPPPMDDLDFQRMVFGDGDVDQTIKNQNSLLKKLIEEKVKLPKLYMTVGKQDPLQISNNELHEFLVKKGVEHIYEEPEGKHNFDFWGREIEKILNWLPHGEKIVLRDSGNVMGV